MKFVTLGTSHGDPTRDRFNSSTLLELQDGGGILFDAGAPVNALLIRHGFDPFARLKHVFITHVHEDHIGGLPGLIKSFVRYPEPGQKLVIHMPEEEAIDAVRNFMKATHRMYPAGMLEFDLLRPGAEYREGDYLVRAFPTRHLERENLNLPSYGFTITKGESRVVFTGDLKADFSDFPVQEFMGPAGCITECTHFPWERAVEVLRELPITRLLCTHIADRFQSEAGEKEFEELCRALPFPAVLARDGGSYDLK